MTSLQIRSRVVVRGDRHVHVVVHVVQDRLDGCRPASQEQVLCVRSSRAWTHDDLAAARDRHAIDDDVIGLGRDARVRARIPPRHLRRGYSSCPGRRGNTDNCDPVPQGTGSALGLPVWRLCTYPCTDLFLPWTVRGEGVTGD